MTSLRARTLKAALLGALGAACSGAPDAEPAGGAAADPADSARGLLLSEVQWSLEWDRARVEPAAAGWATLTDLGYRVRLESGWIVDYGLSLGTCATPAGDTLDAANWAASIDAAVMPMHAEDLAHPSDLGLGPRAFTAWRYCWAHWLLARASESVDAPREASLVGTSLRIDAIWARSGDSGERHVETWWPRGTLVELTALADPDELDAARRDGEPRAAYITVKRDLGALFDGVDFAAASDEVVAARLLENLVARSRLSIGLAAPSSGGR